LPAHHACRRHRLLAAAAATLFVLATFCASSRAILQNPKRCSSVRGRDNSLRPKGGTGVGEGRGRGQVGHEKESHVMKRRAGGAPAGLCSWKVSLTRRRPCSALMT
jgi:hypothetical protein